MFDHLRQYGREFGIVFGDPVLLSNSRLTLEASEYARDMGKHKEFHEYMFHAYFTETLDIGSLRVISSIAAKCDIDVTDLMNALKDGRYGSRLAEARKEGKKISLTGVPTFIINEKYKIVGAQPVAVFKEIFSKVG